MQCTKSDESSTKKPQIAYEILAYLVEYPEAQDTLEGIVEWWLLEQQIKRQTTKVKKALAELVAKRLILERKGEDSRTHYRINRSKYKEIQALLEQQSQCAEQNSYVCSK
ncbi:MAG: hypothetical protein GY797_09665 [Deltaproteobacteria bacterium]|nr:hypothetical protein [Deltaproteobacteria bacterium]